MWKLKGFTLIELMVVIVILGILAAISLPLYNGYVEKGHLAAAKTALAQYHQVLQGEYVRSGYLLKNPSDFNNPPLSNANVNRDIYTFSITGSAPNFHIEARTQKYPSWAYLNVNSGRIFVCKKADPSSCEQV